MPQDSLRVSADAEGLSSAELAGAMGVPESMIYRARELGLAAPDAATGRWPPAAVEDLRSQWPQIVPVIEAARELGAARCADLLTRATGLQVGTRHVEELAERGALRASRLYRHRPLYRVADVESLAADPGGVELLAEVVSGRRAGLPRGRRIQPQAAGERIRVRRANSLATR